MRQVLLIQVAQIEGHWRQVELISSNPKEQSQAGITERLVEQVRQEVDDVLHVKHFGEHEVQIPELSKVPSGQLQVGRFTLVAAHVRH